MGAWFDAVLSAHYHTALLRGHPELHTKHELMRQPGVDFQSWRERIDKIGTSGPILSRILSPPEAMLVLKDHVARHPNGTTTQFDDRRTKHALGAWADYNWHYKELNGQNSEIAERLKNLVRRGRFDQDTLHLDEPPSPMTPDAATTSILKAVHESGTVDAFELIEARVDGSGVTRITAQVTHHDENETVANVAQHTDPRAWSTHFPEIWTSSYCVDDPRVKDRYASPDPARNGKKIGQSFDGYLYENGQVQLLGMSLMGGTVMLDVTFRVVEDDPNNGTVTLTYRLYEALTSSVLCLLSPGGPDVDSAEEGDYIVTLKGGTVTTRVTKHLRFSSEVHFSEELNAFALPLWSWAIVGGLYRTLNLP